MPTVPQLPIPKQQQPAPGQETSDNISEMRGSFRQAAAEVSSRILKKSYGALFSALRFRDKQEDYSAETRRNFQGVTDTLDSVNERVGYAVSILQDINVIQLKSLRLLRDIIDSVQKNKSDSILDKLPKTLLNLLKIAGLAGLAMARSRLGGLAAMTMTGMGALNGLEENKIEKMEPMPQDALAPKTSAGEADGGGGDDEEDSAPELTALANNFEEYVLGDVKENTALANNFEEYVLGDVKKNTAPSTTGAAPTLQPSNLAPVTLNQTTPVKAPETTPISKQNISLTAPAVPQNATADLQAKNNVDANTKLTRSLVFSSDSITFSADEIEFIQKRLENIKSEEIEKLNELDAEDDHVKSKKQTGEERDGISGGPGGTTPTGPPGKNPGNGATPFNGQLNPELGEIKTQSGLTTQVAKDMVPKFQGFVTDLESTGYRIRELGGYANRRNVNDPSKWSAHAYGAAIDINASSNPNQSRQTDMPTDKVQSLIQKHGLGWGLNWQSVGDPMHFSAMPNEGGTGSATSTMTPNDQGGGATGGGGSMGGQNTEGGSTGGGATATPMTKESATPGASSPTTPSATPSDSGSGTTQPQAKTEPVAPTVTITPPTIETGMSINTMSQNASPLKPRASMKEILNDISVQQTQQSGSPTRSFFDPSRSPVRDPSKAGNVEPRDANKRLSELFGDYSSFGNVGSLG